MEVETIRAYKRAGLKPESLTKNESKVVEEIFLLYKEYSSEYSKRLDDLKSLKFDKSTISEKVKMSRMGLDKNLNYKEFIEYLINESKKRDNKLLPYDLIEKSKYQKIKEENKKISINIAKLARYKDIYDDLQEQLTNKDITIQSLNRQLAELGKQNASLVKELEKMKLS